MKATSEDMAIIRKAGKKFGLNQSSVLRMALRLLAETHKINLK